MAEGINITGGPTGDRRSELVVPSARVTGSELETVKTALESPPPKADLFAMLVSVAAALVLVGKVLKESWSQGQFAIDGFNLGLLLGSIALAGVHVYRYVEAVQKKHPFHDQAKRYVQSLIDEQGGTQSTKPAEKAGGRTPLWVQAALTVGLAAVAAWRTDVAWAYALSVVFVWLGPVFSELLRKLIARSGPG